MGTTVTTDVDDSFAVFETKHGYYEVRPVFPDGLISPPIAIFASKARALARKGDLINHLKEWVDVLR